MFLFEFLERGFAIHCIIYNQATVSFFVVLSQCVVRCVLRPLSSAGSSSESWNTRFVSLDPLKLCKGNRLPSQHFLSYVTGTTILNEVGKQEEMFDSGITIIPKETSILSKVAPLRFSTQVSSSDLFSFPVFQLVTNFN